MSDDNVFEFRPRVRTGQQIEGYTFSGDMKCLACGHEFEGVAVDCFMHGECPSCKTHRAVLTSHPVPPDNKVIECTHCMSQVWIITTRGFFCVGCGNHCAP